MGLRQIKRKIVKNQMKQAGVKQPNKTRFKQVDNKGNATTVQRRSFFATHWRDNEKEARVDVTNQNN